MTWTSSITGNTSLALSCSRLSVEVSFVSSLLTYLTTAIADVNAVNLGVAARVKYGFLLDRMNGELPVFRTESQDRMLKSAQNFAAGELFHYVGHLDQTLTR